MTPSIVVVGAGPAGLAAATEAATAGASVIVLDEQAEPGGQLRYRVQPVTVAAGAHAERPDRIAERLVDAALAAGVRISHQRDRRRLLCRSRIARGRGRRCVSRSA